MLPINSTFVLTHHNPPSFLTPIGHDIVGRMEENEGDFDLVEIWKNSSETGQKQFKKALSTIFSSLGRDSSNGTPFDAVGLILSLTHPLPYQI